MENKNDSKPNVLALVLTTGLFLFYCIIILYGLIGVLKINLLENFISCMVFQCIGFLILFLTIIGRFVSKRIATGYYIIIVIMTILYTLLLNVLNLAGVLVIPGRIFVLLHMVLLFFYSVIVVPMYIVGNNK